MQEGPIERFGREVGRAVVDGVVALLREEKLSIARFAAEARSGASFRGHRTAGLEFREVMRRSCPSGARGRFFVTPYAVTRYIERVRPGIDRETALEELIAITSAGTLVGPYRGMRAVRGAPFELWRGPRIGSKRQQDRRSRLRFVVGHAAPGELPQVVTVLKT